MPKRTLAYIVQESLLASEQLSVDRAKAGASTPQAFDAFTKTSEQEGIEQREATKEEEEPMDDTSATDDASEAPADSDEFTPADEGDGVEAIEGEEEPEGAVDNTEDPETTTESMDQWIRDKTQYSNSAATRNLGELTAGLVGLGIKYGPGMLNGIAQGTMWTFSKIGTLVVKAGSKIDSYIERTKNSVGKLESRLSAVERSIIDQLNEGKTVPRAEYRKPKVLSYLNIGKSLDIPANLKIMSSTLVTATSAIAAEVEAGVTAVEQLARSDAKKRATDISAFMKVSPPKRGFKPGAPSGYDISAPNNDVWSLDTAWPGNARLVFVCPKVSNDIKEVMESYRTADMFVATPGADNGVGSLDGLSASELIAIAKATKVLLSACRDVTKTQDRALKMSSSFGNAVQRLFYQLTDEGEKNEVDSKIVNMVYMRAQLATVVLADGITSSQVHATRVAAAAIHLLEDYSKKLASVK